ncbi:MAG: DUF2271 domain-containing protein [Steroidobacteraceae bacterium]
MRRFAILLLLNSGTVAAADFDLSVQIPQMKVIEYHKPYVAIWVEREDQSVAANLALWYAVRDKEGHKWLQDLRQWWRRTGRSQKLPIDGVTGATRASGVHRLKFTSGARPLGTLKPGKYSIVVEAAREVGGRELVKLAFEWPVTGAVHVESSGNTELGAVSLHITP